MITHEEVRIVCGQFMRSHQVAITEAAQKLITETLNAVIVDPHSGWVQIPPAERERHARQYLERLPEALGFLLQTRGVTTISYFDFLGGFASICDWICFEDKEPINAGARNQWRTR
jgi:hypothetical protein